MGGSVSKRIQTKLQSSPLFQAAVQTSFQECLALSQHASADDIFAYQLLHASSRIFHLIPPRLPDPASLLKDKWIPLPPTQLDVDRTIKKEGILAGGKSTLNLEEFRFFSVCAFRDMTLATAEHRLALSLPVGLLGVTCAHFAAIKLPVVGPICQASGFLMPGLLLGSVLGVVAALQLNSL